jgi:putative DNA primase/helicase
LAIAPTTFQLQFFEGAAVSISWGTVERITGGKFGRVMATCPLCSEKRRTPQKRKSKVLAVNRLEAEFAVYFCNHCDASGYAHPESRSPIINLAERERRQDQTKRLCEADRGERIKRALALWNESRPGRCSPIEEYLFYTRGVGEWLDSFPYLDKVLRYHPNCPFGEERLPCMLALVREIKTNAPVAVHRTALNLEGKYPQRIDRKSLGPTSGGAIKISPDHEVTHGLLIGEGIETVLSASKVLQYKPVWSLIDKGNLAKLPVLAGIETVVIAIDNDPNGEGQRAAQECTQRLLQGGIEVLSAQPNKAKDFNDVIKRHHG